MTPPQTRSHDDRPFDPAELSRVFTVQLRDGASTGQALAGRLTHAATGEAVHFASAEELIARLNELRDWLAQSAIETEMR